MNASHRYDILADLFYKRHGMMAPGKSESLETVGFQNEEERMLLWREWNKKHSLEDAIKEIARLTYGVEILEKNG